MTTFDLYRKHKNGEISREKFLYEVRRDNNLPWITNLTSYDDAVAILQNKGIIAEVETKEAKADEAVKAEVKAKKPSEKKPEILSIDYANPYEYRMGLQHELNEIGEYDDESLAKAKEIVLKNLAKDVNFYTTLLNQDQSPYKFPSIETDAKGMQARPDGHLKKELKKDEKANVQDTLGKKEAGKKKPKGVKELKDKGVEGKEKIVKEGLEEDKFYSRDYVIQKYGADKAKEIEANIEDEEDNNPNVWDLYTSLESAKDVDDFLQGYIDEALGGVDLGASFDKLKGAMGAEDEFDQLMSKYDWYYEMSDDPRAYDRGLELDKKLKALGKQIGADKAVAMFNAKAPSDRKVTNTFFAEGEDKHSKIKEALKAALKKEILNPKDIANYKKTGEVVNIPDTDTSAVTAAKNAKLNYRTYRP